MKMKPTQITHISINRFGQDSCNFIRSLAVQVLPRMAVVKWGGGCERETKQVVSQKEEDEEEQRQRKETKKTKTQKGKEGGEEEDKEGQEGQEEEEEEKEEEEKEEYANRQFSFSRNRNSWCHPS